MESFQFFENLNKEASPLFFDIPINKSFSPKPSEQYSFFGKDQQNLENYDELQNVSTALSINFPQDDHLKGIEELVEYKYYRNKKKKFDQYDQPQHTIFPEEDKNKALSKYLPKNVFLAFLGNIDEGKKYIKAYERKYGKGKYWRKKDIQEFIKNHTGEMVHLQGKAITLRIALILFVENKSNEVEFDEQTNQYTKNYFESNRTAVVEDLLKGKIIASERAEILASNQSEQSCRYEDYQDLITRKKIRREDIEPKDSLMASSENFEEHHKVRERENFFIELLGDKELYKNFTNEYGALSNKHTFE